MKYSLPNAKWAITASERRAFALEPSSGPRVALEQRRHLLPYFFMICIHPFTFLHREERHIDEVSTHRRLSRKCVSTPLEGRTNEGRKEYHSDMLKP